MYHRRGLCLNSSCVYDALVCRQINHLSPKGVNQYVLYIDWRDVRKCSAHYPAGGADTPRRSPSPGGRRPTRKRKGRTAAPHRHAGPAAAGSPAKAGRPADQAFLLGAEPRPVDPGSPTSPPARTVGPTGGATARPAGRRPDRRTETATGVKACAVPPARVPPARALREDTTLSVYKLSEGSVGQCCAQLAPRRGSPSKLGTLPQTLTYNVSAYYRACCPV